MIDDIRQAISALIEAEKQGKYLEALYISGSLLEAGYRTGAPEPFMNGLYQRAEQHYRNSLTINNDAARYYYVYACYYYTRYLIDVSANLEEAERIIEKAIAEVGADKEEAKINNELVWLEAIYALLDAQYVIAEEKYELNRAREALDKASKILEKMRPKLTKDVYQRKLTFIKEREATLKIRDGRFREALIDYEELGDPFNIGCLRLLTGDFKGAIEPLELTLEQIPQEEVSSIVTIKLLLLLSSIGCEDYERATDYINELDELAKKVMHPSQVAYFMLANACKLLMDGSALSNREGTLSLLRGAEEIYRKLGATNVFVAQVGYEIALALLGERRPEEQANEIDQITSKYFTDKPRQIISKDIVLSLGRRELKEALKHYLRLLVV
ncbi:MAG: hypothetical protein QXH96_00485 [Candidatus Geothermarchaeota archaeon]